MKASAIVVTTMICATSCESKRSFAFENPPLPTGQYTFQERSITIDFPTAHTVTRYAWASEDGVSLSHSVILRQIERYADRHGLVRETLRPRDLDSEVAEPPLGPTPRWIRGNRAYSITRCLVSVDPVLVIELDRPISMMGYYPVIFETDRRAGTYFRTDAYDPIAVLPKGIYASRVLPAGRILRWYDPSDLATPPQTPSEDWEELALTEELLLVRRADGGSEVQRK